MIKKLIQQIRFKINPTNAVRHEGVQCGNDNTFIGMPCFGSEPWLISIGDKNLISSDVLFSNHDGSTNVIRKLDKRYAKAHKFGYIKIGSNNFIGARTTILPDVEIGDFCVVGANSLVTKDIPSHEVWGGYQPNLYAQ